MADSATLGSRLTAARAITTTQTSGTPAPAATPPKASEPAQTAEVQASSTTASTSPAAATSAEEQGKPGGDDTEGKADAPKTPEELKKQFVAIDRREKKLKRQRKEWEESKKAHEAAVEKAKLELIEENRRISALQRGVEQKFGWAARGEQAWDGQDKVAFAKAIERMAKGASLASITQWLAGALDHQPKGAEKKEPNAEEEAWRREKAEFERKQAEERAKAEGSKKEQSSAERREQAKARLASAFGKHPYLANPDEPGKPDPDALNEALGKVAEAMKSRRVGETPNQVAKRVLDELHAREVRRLKRLGLEPKTPAASAKPAEKQGERLPEPPPTNRNGKPPSPDETRAHRIAAARRMTELQRRGVS